MLGSSSHKRRVIFLSTYGFSIFRAGSFVVVNSHPLQAIARYSNSWEVNNKQCKEMKVHFPSQVPDIVVQSIEDQGVGYPEPERIAKLVHFL